MPLFLKQDFDFIESMTKYFTIILYLFISSIILAGCRDDLRIPETIDLEETEDLQFLVKNCGKGWESRSFYPVPASWRDLPVMDSVNMLYPSLFIRKGVKYEPQHRTLTPLYDYYDPENPGDVIDKGVERYPGSGSYTLSLAVQSNSDRSGRLKVVTTAFTDETYSELRALGKSIRSADSRSVIVDEKNLENLYSRIGISGVCYEDSFSFKPHQFKVIENTLFENNGNRWTSVGNSFYWNVWTDDYNLIRFFSYAPYDAPGLKIAEDADDGTQQFDFTVPVSVDDQIDLGAATVDAPGNYRHTVPLLFDHILTGVRFLVDDKNLASCLTKVTLGGVYGSGRYKHSVKPYNLTDYDDFSNPNINGGISPDAQDREKGSWIPLGTPDAEYTLADDDFFGNKREPILSEFSKDSEDDWWCVTDPDRMFMLIPQKLPESAYIEAEFHDKNDYIKMRGKIGGKDADDDDREWEQGTIVTYVITTFDIEYVLKLVKEGGRYPYTGGFDDKTVVSYARYYDKAGNLRKIAPIEWYPVLYDAQGKEISSIGWSSVTYDPKPGSKGDFRPAEYGFADNPNDFAEWFEKNLEDSVCCGHVNVSPQGALYSNSTYSILKNATPLGTADNPVNLATLRGNRQDGAYSTANCYMINQPGYYKIPLVYGNAIKNGAPNEEAYRYTGNVNQHRHYTFENHLGNPITNPYIKNCGVPISDAAIVTTTAKNAVQLVYLDDDFLTIYIDPLYIDQGNTIVAVRDNKGDIMWSWHLWTTANNPYLNDNVTVTTNNGEPFTFMTINIGWHTPDPTGGDDERAAYWKPAQNRGSAVLQPDKIKEEAGIFVTKNSYRIWQQQYNATRSGFAPAFNWGRKDPLMGIPHRTSSFNSGSFGEYYAFRATYANQALTTHNLDGSQTYSLSQGYNFVKQFTPGESVKVPWAVPSVCNLSFNPDPTFNDFQTGATTNAYYVSWWTGNGDHIYKPGPVPLKKELWADHILWPSGRVSNGDGGGFSDNYTRYDDLWCVGQSGTGYLSHAQGDRIPIKTVYDPCPPEFMVPPNRAFDRLNKNTGKLENGTYYFPESGISFCATSFLSARIGGATTPTGISASISPGLPMEPGDQSISSEYPHYSYVYPFTLDLFENTLSIWTSDVSCLVHGSYNYIYGSYYNITGAFVSNPLNYSDNGNTAQEGGVNDARSSGNLWSMNGRQVRAVREK